MNVVEQYRLVFGRGVNLSISLRIVDTATGRCIHMHDYCVDTKISFSRVPRVDYGLVYE